MRRIEKALLVLVLDPKIRAWLRANDPKAFEQALLALGDQPLAESTMTESEREAVSSLRFACL